MLQGIPQFSGRVTSMRRKTLRSFSLPPRKPNGIDYELRLLTVSQAPLKRKDLPDELRERLLARKEVGINQIFRDLESKIRKIVKNPKARNEIADRLQQAAQDTVTRSDIRERLEDIYTRFITQSLEIALSAKSLKIK